MSELTNFINILNTDPGTMTGVPSDAEIIAANKLSGAQLTDGVRQGFLEMWSFVHAKDVLSEMPVPVLEEIHTQAREKMADPELPVTEFEDIRFAVNASALELGARQYISKEGEI